MKKKSIIILAFMLLTSVMAIAGVSWPWSKPAPEIKFTTKDGQVIASLTFTATNSPFIVDTSTKINHETKTATLGFVIIQNFDLLQKSARQIEVEWQLGEINQSDYSFKLEGSKVLLKTDELKTLLSPEKQAPILIPSGPSETARDKWPIFENKALRVRADLTVHSESPSPFTPTPPIFLLRVEVENLTGEKVTLAKPTITPTTGKFRVDRWYEEGGAGQEWDGVLKAREKKTINVIGEAGGVLAGEEITTTVALDSLTFEVKTTVIKSMGYRCPCGCDRSEKMAEEIGKMEANAALDAIDKALASIAEREDIGYVTEEMIVHRLRLQQLAGEIRLAELLRNKTRDPHTR